MRVADNEFSDPAVHEPRVAGSPAEVWLVYGELEHDDTHANCADSGEVTWCEDAQFPADVRYMRADLAGEQVRAAVAADRERLVGLLSSACSLLRAAGMSAEADDLASRA